VGQVRLAVRVVGRSKERHCARSAGRTANCARGGRTSRSPGHRRLVVLGRS